MIEVLRSFLAKLLLRSQSVDNILHKHRKTIDALNDRADQMADTAMRIEEGLRKECEALKKATDEMARAKLIAEQMSKVFLETPEPNSFEQSIHSNKVSGNIEFVTNS
jgi:hypothetical protein